MIDRNNGNINKQEQHIDIRKIDRLSGQDIIYRSSRRLNAYTLLRVWCYESKQMSQSECNPKWNRKQREREKPKSIKIGKHVKLQHDFTSEQNKFPCNWTHQCPKMPNEFCCYLQKSSFSSDTNEKKHKNWLKTKYLTDVIRSHSHEHTKRKWNGEKHMQTIRKWVCTHSST